MRVVGAKPTSPKASRGKAGVRTDIDPNIYFYSRWEANIARIFNGKGIKWEFGPKTFDIGGQHYTPDFYLPERNLYIEVKNFWSEYSAERDRRFRERYPHVRLKVILKAEYLFLEGRYAVHIPNWEYKGK
jgi:predicted nuclease of restriction endonuclease-like RecB superfamily